MQINYFIPNQNPSEKLMLKSILEQISSKTNLTPVRIVFFTNAKKDSEIADQRELLKIIVDNHYKENKPSWCIIAQAPICTNNSEIPANGQTLPFAAEVSFLDKQEIEKISYKSIEQIPYIVIENNNIKRLFVSGVVSEESDVINDQCIGIFDIIKRILIAENMPINSIVRQWNYIPHIVSTVENYQNYQQFNDARSAFYNQTTWNNGYPAATGIGTLCGKIKVDLDATTGLDCKVINNKLQIAAHVYSQEVLIGQEEVHKTTPKFERAKTAGSWLYVSGTASIRGEESIGWDDIKEQTEVTLDNIKQLTDEAGSQPMNSLRAYLKKPEFAETSKSIVSKQNPGTEAIYVVSDVCRDELLIEIEATAEI